jgi:UDP-2,3-diacylglucosamine hydrolase
MNAAIPALSEFKAPAGWQAVEFISDLHLGPDTPRSFEAWAAYLRNTDADAVFMLGDLFEAWVGDDAVREPGSFEARCAQVLADAARQRPLAFMAGNRDFLVGEALCADTGLVALPDPTVLDAFGERVLLTHGDALCLSDTAYQALRRQVRSAAWRSAVLAQPLAQRRRLASQMRDASEANRRSQAPADWIDVDTGAAVAWLHAAGSRHMVHGHTHRPAIHTLAPRLTRHVLSDWDLEAPTPRAEVLRFTRDGFTRRMP